MKKKLTHILSVDQFTLVNLSALFKTALKFEVYAQGKKIIQPLKNKILINLFFEPSTRTRLSFATAFHRLGGCVQELGAIEASSISKGESLADTIRMVSNYADVIVMRHPQINSVKEMAAISSVPLINAGDGAGEHPSQALLDLYTIFKQRGKKMANISKLKITFVGDLKYSRTVHSLVKLLSLFAEVEFTFVAPAAIQVSKQLIDFLQAKNHAVHITDNFIQGLQTADIIYMTRIQEERFESKAVAQQFKGLYLLSREKLTRYCKSHAAIMHPLPRDSRPGLEEIAQDLDDHPNLLIFNQAANGVPIRMALFSHLLD